MAPAGSVSSTAAPVSASTAPAPLSPSPGAINATAPAPVQAFGPTAQVGTTYANAATVDPNSAQQYLNQYEQAFNTSMAPQYQQQQQQLENSLQARGLQNTGAGGQLDQQLLASQGATTASAYDPLIQQAFGYNQADTSQNASNQQGVNSQNASASNSSALANAGFYTNNVNQNANSYNSYLNTLYGSGANEQNSLLTAYLNSFGPQSGVTNAMSQGLSGQQNAYTNTLYGANAAAASNTNAAASAFAAGG